MPTFGSLFAGIGGIDLGLERAGWTGRWQVEWDEFCQRVLARHWPDIPRYGDITTVDWSEVEPVDLISGGFPCQPFSVAGRRRGIEDERWLWPTFATAIRALRPRYVLVENVPGLLAGHGGMGAVLGDLAELGYDAEWDSIPAAAVGAPHLRYRVWIVAHRAELGWPLADADFWRPFHPLPAGRDAAGDGGSIELADSERNDVEGTEFQPGLDGGSWPSGRRPLADSDSEGPQGRQVQPERPDQRSTREGGVADTDIINDDRGGHGTGSDGWQRDRAGAVSEQWRVEPNVGRVAHGVPYRVDRLRSLGNAVVPHVVEVIGRQLLATLENAR